MSGKQVKNNGKLEQYFVENNHEPIIGKDIFNKVQDRININLE